VTRSTLRFQPKATDAGRVLRCRAENPVMVASQIEDAWSLDVDCEFRVRLSHFHLRRGDPSKEEKGGNSRESRFRIPSPPFSPSTHTPPIARPTNECVGKDGYPLNWLQSSARASHLIPLDGELAKIRYRSQRERKTDPINLLFGKVGVVEGHRGLLRRCR